MPLLLGSSLMLQRAPCYNTTSKDDTDMSIVVTRVKALEDSMNEYMKQQSSQMSNLMNTVKKMSPPVNTGNASGPGASFIQQQRVRLESVSKKHKLDDDDIEVFPAPPLQPPVPRVTKTIHPSGRSSQSNQPPVRLVGTTPQGNQTPSYAEAMQKNTTETTQQPPFRPRRQSTLLFGQAKTGKDN